MAAAQGLSQLPLPSEDKPLLWLDLGPRAEVPASAGLLEKLWRVGSTQGLPKWGVGVEFLPPSVHHEICQVWVLRAQRKRHLFSVHPLKRTPSKVIRRYCW